jgi:MarR-like DNA-binding transcriptional regulator SgrR of sgrS sRNA
MVTSGPYYVKEYVSGPTGKLKLKLNPYSPIRQDASPDEATLLQYGSTDEQVAAYKDGNLSVFSAPAFTWLKRFREFDKLNGKIIEGHPNAIHFIVPNLLNQDGKDLKIRKSFAAFLQKTAHEHLKSKRSSDRLIIECQMIPIGYSGHLDDVSLPKPEISTLKGKKLRIHAHKHWVENPAFFDDLVESARANHFQIEVHYVNYSQTSPEDTEHFGKVMIFKGNQKDSLGSWSFLFSEGRGALRHSRNNFQTQLEQAAKETHPIARTEIIQRIHRRVLEEALAIPVFAERSRTYHKPELDLSAWNPYDMRLRIYDIRVK